MKYRLPEIAAIEREARRAAAMDAASMARLPALSRWEVRAKEAFIRKIPGHPRGGRDPFSVIYHEATHLSAGIVRGFEAVSTELSPPDRLGLAGVVWWTSRPDAATVGSALLFALASFEETAHDLPQLDLRHQLEDYADGWWDRLGRDCDQLLDDRRFRVLYVRVRDGLREYGYLDADGIRTIVEDVPL